MYKLYYDELKRIASVVQYRLQSLFHFPETINIVSCLAMRVANTHSIKRSLPVNRCYTFLLGTRLRHRPSQDFILLRGQSRIHLRPFEWLVYSHNLGVYSVWAMTKSVVCLPNLGTQFSLCEHLRIV